MNHTGPNFPGKRTKGLRIVFVESHVEYSLCMERNKNNWGKEDVSQADRWAKKGEKNEKCKVLNSAASFKQVTLGP